MTEHALFDFHNMPLTTEQKILATLERIEVLLTTKAVVASPQLINKVVPAPLDRTPTLSKEAKGKK